MTLSEVLMTIWLVVGGVYLAGLLFALALCRVAGSGTDEDLQPEPFFATSDDEPQTARELVLVSRAPHRSTVA